MKAIRSLVIELLVLSVLAVGLGLGANAVRAATKKKGVIKLSRNYHDMGTTRRPTAPASVNRPAIEDDSPTVQNPAQDREADAYHLDTPYTVLNVAEAAEIFRDPNTELGVNVFVDARDDDDFSEGHIPGAVLCDHNNLDLYLDIVLDHALGAEKVIAYCNGGDCELSQLVCVDLEDAGVPIDNLFLFAGGLDAWKAEKLPIATGTDDGGE